MRFQDKNVLVVGAGVGVGRGLAIRYAMEGANVIAADKHLSSARRTAAEIMARGGKALAVQVDVGCEGEVEAMLANARRTFGCIDLLIAAVGAPAIPHYLQLTEEEWKPWLFTLGQLFVITSTTQDELACDA